MNIGIRKFYDTSIVDIATSSTLAQLNADNAAGTASGAGAQQAQPFDPRTGAVIEPYADSSLFNPFYIFKYTGGSQIANKEALGFYFRAASKNSSIAYDKIQNPTAANIIEWSNSESWGKAEELSYSPYSWADFIFCKYYGVIPNNRLVTLRKYPLGVDDRQSLSRPEVNNIPVAQAVTWFGDISGNDINKLWQSSWSLKWSGKTTGDNQQVQGNEVTNFSQGLVNLFGKGTGTTGFSAIENILKAVGSVVDAQVALGPDKTNDVYKNFKDSIAKAGKAKLQDRIQALQKAAYTDAGAFWNQINGPVNVITNFLIRDRGLSSEAVQTPIKLKFVYRTDSYYGLGQRRVALDILANMLKLTYSDGEWLANINTYYKQLGIAISESEQTALEGAMKDGNLDVSVLTSVLTSMAKTRLGTALTLLKGLSKEAVSAVGGSLTYLGGLFTGKGDVETNFSMDALIANAPADGTQKTVNTAVEGLEQKFPVAMSILEAGMINSLVGALPNFLQKRSAVADIPTGNWHLTIGNPMNPIIKIGNLACYSCSCSFNDELGPDDFPTEMTFDVELRPMRPRDGVGIRQMFDIGKRDYITSQLGTTSDQINTYGANVRIISDLSNGVPLATAVTSAAGGNPVSATANQAAQSTNAGGLITNNSSHATEWIKRYWASEKNKSIVLNSETQKRLESVYFFRPDLSLESMRGTFTQSTPSGASSDIRLKENILLVGVSPSGINIYEFKYKGRAGRYRGVIAQELIGTPHEDAILIESGYYAVDYSRIDVDFLKLENTEKID